MLGLSAAALVVASALAPHALAHGGVLPYSIAGTWYDGWKVYNNPVGQSTVRRPWGTSPHVNAVACNDDGTSPAMQFTATITAGSPITAFWNTWPHDTGPVLTYLAQCQCPGSTYTGVNANSLKWFKIDEAGLLSGSVGAGTWALDQI